MQLKASYQQAKTWTWRLSRVSADSQLEHFIAQHPSVERLWLIHLTIWRYPAPILCHYICFLQWTFVILRWPDSLLLHVAKLHLQWQIKNVLKMQNDRNDLCIKPCLVYKWYKFLQITIDLQNSYQHIFKDLGQNYWYWLHFKFLCPSLAFLCNLECCYDALATYFFLSDQLGGGCCCSLKKGLRNFNASECYRLLPFEMSCVTAPRCCPVFFFFCHTASPLVRVHSSERHAATHVAWRGSATGGISGDGWYIFLTAYLSVWVMAPPLREIQLELEISGQCWLPAHSHRPGSVSSTSGSVWAQEEKVRRKQTAEGLESWDRHGNGLSEKVHTAAVNFPPSLYADIQMYYVIVD